MSENNGKGLLENKATIQTLFQKLTEIILSSPKSKLDVTNLVVIVGNWVTVVFASLVVMVEGNDPKKANMSVDRITMSINNDIKKHIVMIRGLKAKASEEKIILPSRDPDPS